jgi:hypothetical protein
MGIGFDECMEIQTEFNAMVESGKTVEELETEMQASNAMCGSASQGGYSGCDAQCGINDDCKQSCMQINQNGACRVDRAGCARQVAYGGYVKSEVLIQCYGKINEGCKRLKTQYMPVEYNGGKAPASAQGSSQGFPSCNQLCQGNCGAQCQSHNGSPNLRVNTDWSWDCMKQSYNRYLRCIGKRTAQCYRQKWIVTKEVVNAAPTSFPGCTKNFNMPYNCASGSSGCGCGN